MAAVLTPGILPAPPARGPPTLRRRCLHLLASALVDSPATPWHERQRHALQAGMQALPQELQLELLTLLASWRLLDVHACQLLGCAASCSGSSILAGAASFSMAGCVLLTPTSLHGQLLCCPLPRLASLSLKGVAWLDDADVCSLLQHLPGLLRLDMSKCPRLTAAAVAAVAASAAAPRLQALSLARCWQVAALPGLHACSRLTSLDLSGCWQLTGGAVRPVLAAAPLLEELALAGCSQLTDGVLVCDSISAGPSGLRAAAGVPAAAAAAVAAQGAAAEGGQAVEVAAAGGEPAAGQGAAAHAPAPAVGQLRRRLQELGAAGGGANAARQGAAAGGEGEGEPGWEHVAFNLDQLRFPVEGVPLAHLRSLDLSGTAATDCLLYWLAQRCCARLQRLVLTGAGAFTELGLSAVLAAKRALLHIQACPARTQPRQEGGGAAAPPAAPGQAGEALPLLELLVGSCPAATKAGNLHCLAGPHLRAAQQRWEATQGGGMQLWLAPAGGGGSGASAPASLRLSLLEDPPDASCPFCANQADTLAGFQQGWPPESTAQLLAALGERGLGGLQALDVAGSYSCGDTADVVAASCSSLQRLRLAGCRTLVDDTLELMLSALPRLQELDVSGCNGQRRSRPGSGFVVGKAARLQEGGLTDASICQLARLQPSPASMAASQATSREQAARSDKVTAGAPDAANGTPVAAAVAAGAGAPAAPPAGLQALNASGLSITDASLASLPASLTSVQLRGCKRLGDSGALQLLARCRGLTRLDAAGCSQLTAAGFGCYTPFGSEQAQQGEQQQGGSGGQQQRAGGWQRQQHPNCSSFGSWEEQALEPAVTPSQPRPTKAPGSSASGDAPRDSSAAAEAAAAVTEQPEQAQQLLRPYRRVVSTAAGVSLQRAALPRQACTREVLAWLAGQASCSDDSGGSGVSSGGSGSGSNGGAAGCGPLQRLELASCAALAESDLLALAACCPQLKTLQLGGAAAAVGGALCAALARHCRLLSRLSVTGGASLADADVALLLRELPALQHLELSGCNSVSGSAFVDAASQRRLPAGQADGEQKQAAPQAEQRAQHAAGQQLEQGQQASEQQQQQQQQGQYSMSQQKQHGAGQGPRGGAGACAGSGSGPAVPPASTTLLLRTLRMERCAIVDAAAVAIVEACPHLEVLSLRQCTRVTGRTAVAALRRCRNLRQLLLGGTAAADCGCSDAELASLRAGSSGQNIAPEEALAGSTPEAPSPAPTRLPSGGQPLPPPPAMLALVELPPAAAQHCQRWSRLLSSPQGSPRLVYAD